LASVKLIFLYFIGFRLQFTVSVVLHGIPVFVLLNSFVIIIVSFLTYVYTWFNFNFDILLEILLLFFVFIFSVLLIVYSGYSVLLLLWPVIRYFFFVCELFI
jgi:hypothetical protein